MPSEHLFTPIFTGDEVAAATSGDAWVDAIAEFERELAAAEAELGLIPPGAAEAVAAAADRSLGAPGDLGRAGRSSGTPVVPIVEALTARLDDGELGRAGAGGYGAAVHYGATSQDAMDTAAMLVARRASRLILADLDAAADACASLAREHRRTIATGRTLLQPAVPVTFGLKAAKWLVALADAADCLERVVRERLAVQLGGAAGTMAAFGDKGPALSARLAERLGLADPLLPWHTDRSRVVELAGALVGAANAAGKVALDVVLLAQSEVGEAAEGGGHGGSSTMPHKANAITSVTVLAAARLAHGAAGVIVAGGVQEHERAATGGWHAEWHALTELLRAAGGCTAGLRSVLDGLEVDAARMAGNVGRARGALTAEHVALDLARDLGRREAAALVGRASARAAEEGTMLRDVLARMPEVVRLRSAAELDELCDPARYLGACDLLVDRALARHAERRKATR